MLDNVDSHAGIGNNFFGKRGKIIFLSRSLCFDFFIFHFVGHCYVLIVSHYMI